MSGENVIWAKLNSVGKRVKSQNLTNPTFSIGRHPESDLSIQDPRISNRHCKILKKLDEDGNQVIIIEDQSSNGTFLNSTLVRF